MIATLRHACSLTLLVALMAGNPVYGQNADLDAVIKRLPKTLPVPPAPKEKDLLSQLDNRIDPSLMQLARAAKSKAPAELSQKAFELGVPYQTGLVAVSLSPPPLGNAQALISELQAQGSVVTATLGNQVYAKLPAASLEKLTVVRTLGFAAPQGMSYPMEIKDYGRTISEGVMTTGVRRLHDAGIKGKGVKIGILDFGFMRYDDLVQAGELPPPKARQAFNEEGRLDVNTVHGTACAEIIHDMAPEADLYLAAVNGRDDQIIQAALWLAQQGVDIISFSGGGYGGPLNGRAPLDLLVEKIVTEAGILWVNAAGNQASQHWLGQAVDRNGNTLIDVPNNEADVILMQAGGEQLVVFVSWDDWGDNPQLPAASQDIDAYLALIDPSTGHPRLVAQSNNPQNGRGRPMEAIGVRTTPGQIFGLLLKAERVNRPVKIHVIVQGAAGIKPAVATGSISIPATAAKALSVAAVDVQSGQLEPYSSQGPTDDGRIKPDIAAPDKNLSLAYGERGQPGRFPGTSAACPHVSGYASLFKQLEPGFKVESLRKVVIQHVKAMGSPVPNNQFGYGHINAAQVQIAGARPPQGQQPPAPPTGQAPGESLRTLQPILDLLEKPKQ